jgi:hypothetical protein
MDIKWTGKNQLRALWIFQHVLVIGLVISYWVAADKIKGSRYATDVWCFVELIRSLNDISDINLTSSGSRCFTWAVCF